MSAQDEPSLSVKLSLSPSTYSFSNPASPVLALNIESHADRPLTLFTWRTPFDSMSGMTNDCFPVIDTADNTPIPQASTRFQRAPFSRVRGSGDEKYFLTLYPHIPTVVLTAFSRGGTIPPQPRAIVERGWELDEHGNERKVRRSIHACGVDGLEGGHRYKVGVAGGELIGIWWRWGVKEEMLVDRGSLRWSFSELEREQMLLNVGEIEWVELSVDD